MAQISRSFSEFNFHVLLCVRARRGWTHRLCQDGLLLRSCQLGGLGQSAECPVWWSGGAVGDVTWPVAHAATTPLDVSGLVGLGGTCQDLRDLVGHIGTWWDIPGLKRTYRD